MTTGTGWDHAFSMAVNNGEEEVNAEEEEKEEEEEDDLGETIDIAGFTAAV